MMDKKFLNKLFIITLLSFIFLVQSNDAFAWRWPWRRQRRPPPHHRRVVNLPRGYLTIVIGGLRYHYHHGFFYRKGVSGYVVVTAPVGAVIATLPIGYKIIMIGRDKYYYHSGVYYRSYPSGYIVVPAPVVSTPVATIVEPVPITGLSEKASEQTTVVINVPNLDGSYTPVVLQKSGDGYVGPQGEYYPGNPTVEQLKVLYAK